MLAHDDPRARILGCDFGTSGVTFGLYNPHENVMEGFGTADYAEIADRPHGWVEQDPRDWIKAIPAAMDALHGDVSFEAEQVVGIGIGGHMHALVLLDEQNKPVEADGGLLQGAIMWNDPRGEPQGAALSEAFAEPIPARMTASRVRWFAESHPQPWREQVHRVTVPSSYVGLEFTGEFGVGPGDASGMIGQLDAELRMDAGKLKQVAPELPDRYPRVVKAGEVLGKLNKRGAKLLGLEAGIPVAPPEGDQPVGMVASGAVLPGQASVSLGNSVVFNLVGNDAILTERGAIDSFRTATGDHLLMTCVTSGTVVYDELVELFEPVWPVDRTLNDLRTWLAQQAEELPPGCGGVMALPFYLGEGVFRTPDAFAAFVGLRRRGLRAGHLARASMEGTSLVMRYGYEQMKAKARAEVEQLVVSGGGSQNSLWLQILADAFGMPVVLPQDAHEAATRGAAYLALYMLRRQAGESVDLASLVNEKVQYGPAIEPNRAHHDIYSEMLAAMLETREQLAPLYEHAWFRRREEKAK